mmetsp:Transcript_3193/g.4676  ORF Transcript_3193/g.4676 Transcript_3193/m.4676 type:complete len:94 (+) Transcript_3193:95-376(+)
MSTTNTEKPTEPKKNTDTANAKAADKPPVDVSKLTDEERNIYERYGCLPGVRLKVGGKKTRFDSADYFMNDAAKRARGGRQGVAAGSQPADKK